MASKNGLRLFNKQIAAHSVALRFLTEEEMAALKFAIGESEGLTVEECHDPSMIDKHFLATGTNFMMYDTGEKSVCLAWVLGDDESFVSHYIHEELHRVLHEQIGIDSCSAYDRIARLIEKEAHEPPTSAIARYDALITDRHFTH